VAAVSKRLREELAKLEVEVNEEKTRVVDLTKDECFGFLGFDFRRVQSLTGTWRAQFTPKLKKRTALLRKLADVFKHSHSQPAMRVVERINPIVRGWVNYFAIGHSGRCFSYVRDWVEMKLRRHLLRNQQRRGFGWQRRRRAWLYGTLGLFGDYRVRYYAAPTGGSAR
jgi:RNA-directed DNA polymerase